MYIYRCIFKYIYTYIYTYIYIFIYIWANYSDLTATSLESWLIREIIPKLPSFRLVNDYDLYIYVCTRTYLYIYIFTYIYIYIYIYMSWNQYLFVRTCWDHFGKHCKYLQSYWKHFETMVMFDSHHPPLFVWINLAYPWMQWLQMAKKNVGPWLSTFDPKDMKPWNPTNVWMKCSEL